MYPKWIKNSIEIKPDVGRVTKNWKIEKNPTLKGQRKIETLAKGTIQAFLEHLRHILRVFNKTLKQKPPENKK